MSKKIKNSIGFTLIELLVVIAIIGIIGIVIVASFTNVKARSRDSRRVADIRSMQEALALYLSTHSAFPIQNPGEVALTGSDAIETALKNENILRGNMVDSLSGQTVNGEVFDYYYSTDTTGKTYTLRYCQETTSIQGQTQNCANQVSQGH